MEGSFIEKARYFAIQQKRTGGNVTIHTSAIVHPTAHICAETEIGPEAIIERNVTVGAETTIAARVVIGEGSRIGKSCRIFESAKIGVVPKSSAPKGKRIGFVMGDENIVQECAVLERGITGKTIVGDRNLFMANSRVGPDCAIGDNVVLAVGATLAGRNNIGDYAVLGGLAAVDSSCRIGTHALVTAASRVSRDIPPYMLASGTPARLFGVNGAALRNRGFPEDKLVQLERAYNIIFGARHSLRIAVKKLAAEGLSEIKEIQEIIKFIQDAQKSAHPGGGGKPRGRSPRSFKTKS
ncbi:MAG: acyl-ACP--UDP-N-acetylglucosamine O-acyltransferase [candidate division KSB1 bacterium]|nr:acyl-ACP--UDP-N-acetylglucosamine O-acyltransferase [candidate division KSB1 bacterium]